MAVPIVSLAWQNASVKKRIASASCRFRGSLWPWLGSDSLRSKIAALRLRC